MKKPKVTYRKYMGDDQYSYAIFRDGRVIEGLTGLNLSQARYYKRQVEGEIAEHIKKSALESLVLDVNSGQVSDEECAVRLDQIGASEDELAALI
jgi:hypothetical protein